jgi:anti-sigma-K factor RskA
MADDHDPIEELLGAYALDALDDHERRQVEAYLDVNPRARAEVEAHRQVATMLAFSGASAPDGVWDRIVAALEERPPVPGPELARVLPLERTRRSRRKAIGAAALAAIAAAAAGVVVTIAVRDDPAETSSPSDAVQQAFDEAWADPAGRRAVLTSEVDGSLRAEAIVEPSGLGFLSASGLPELPGSETYQLWGVYADDDVISLGVLGNRPGIEPFTAEGDVQAVVITREPAGGVASSTSGALLVGALE